VEEEEDEEEEEEDEEEEAARGLDTTSLATSSLSSSESLSDEKMDAIGWNVLNCIHEWRVTLVRRKLNLWLF
jgi:hypothetical protein